jgi:hypothetical protein
MFNNGISFFSRKPLPAHSVCTVTALYYYVTLFCNIIFHHKAQWAYNCKLFHYKATVFFVTLYRDESHSLIAGKVYEKVKRN